MNISRESIFISAIRSFFNTLLGTVGIFVAIIPTFIILSFFSMGEHKEGLKNKLEILPDLEGNTKFLSLNSPCILRIDIHGIIGKNPLTSQDVYYQLIESRKHILKNNRVKGILLHVNSPGGVATDSDDIYRNLMNYKKKFNVPIYAYVDGFCASGSFLISCASDKILSSPFSVVGSVGSKLGPFFNFSKILENNGIESSTITDGKDKDMMNPFRPWGKDEEESLQDVNEYIYNRFVDIVANARNISRDKIINDYGAKIFNSEKAKEIGYIDDANSSYEQTLEELLKKADINTAKTYQIVTLHPKKTWYQPFMTQTKCFIENFLKEFFLSSKFTNNLKADNFYQNAK